MIKKIKDFLPIFHKAGNNLVRHDGVEHAGFLAFMAILAIFPFLVFFVAILGLLGETAAGKSFILSLLQNAPPHFVSAVKPQIREIISGAPQGLLTFAIIGTIWTSSSMVEGLRTILNRAYNVQKAPNYWRRRLISIAQIFALVLLLIITMFALVLAPALFQKIYALINSFNDFAGITGGKKIYFDKKHFSFFGVEWSVLRHFGVLTITLLFVSLVYYSIPNVKQSWRKTLPGAALTVIGWLAAGQVFSIYVTKYSQIASIYGSLGGIIAFLLFFYIAAIIFIYGAEFNYLLEKAKGNKIKERE